MAKPAYYHRGAELTGRRREVVSWFGISRKQVEVRLEDRSTRWKTADSTSWECARELESFLPSYERYVP